MTVNEMEFGFMFEKGTIDSMFMLRRLQEEYSVTGQSCICFVDLEKAFDRVTRIVLNGNEKDKNITSFMLDQ